MVGSVVLKVRNKQDHGKLALDLIYYALVIIPLSIIAYLTRIYLFVISIVFMFGIIMVSVTVIISLYTGENMFNYILYNIRRRFR